MTQNDWESIIQRSFDSFHASVPLTYFKASDAQKARWSTLVYEVVLLYKECNE